MNRRQAVLILGLEEPFTEEELKRQYKFYVKKFHPDNEASADEDKFMEVKEAYEFLIHSKDSAGGKIDAGDNSKKGTPCQMCNGVGMKRTKVKTSYGYMARKVTCQYCKGTGVQK